MIGNHATTIATDEQGWTHVTYHQTQVVSFHPDKGVVLRSGGWQTVTTKRRMNETAKQFRLGFRVFQKAFEWFVETRWGTVPFADGINILNRTG